MTRLVILFMVALVFAAAGCSGNEGGNTMQKDAAAEYNMVIVTADGPVYYNVEDAVTPQERSEGLMFRETLAADSGMFFDMSDSIDGKFYMWMENTKIPLDMLFLNETGEIVHIHENAAPMSRTVIESPVPSYYVVEVNAGDVEMHGIKIGDQVRHLLLDGLD